MKRCVSLYALILISAGTALAGPLQKQEISADAKWVLHLDVDKLRSTPEGDALVREVANRVLAKPIALLKQEADFDLDFTKASSITAYGDYSESNNVILLKTDLDMEKLVDGALAAAAKHKNMASWPVDKSFRDGVVTYDFPDHVGLRIRSDKITLFSKSSAATDKANEVIAGRAANLSSSSAFSDFPDMQKAFFFLAAAEGFNANRELNAAAGSDGKNNPKAKILKLTESGRIVLGQDADQIYVNVSLKAKTPELVTQMQQVVQGMVALASLMQSDNENIQQLTDSAKVSAAGNLVSINLNFPADKALLLLNQQLEHIDHAHAMHHGTNAPAKTDEK